MAIAKKVGLVIIGIIIVFLVININAVIYGIQQGSGQAEVLWNAKEIEDLLNDPNFPDSTKQKFRYIQEVKLFAEKQLGLTKTDNYTTFYDQKGKPILWVVTASPGFKVEAHEWDFPIAGSFPYKGFFDLEKARKEKAKFDEKNFDTELDEVNAWSTLGWFRDPILSSMLLDGEGRLAELIIHESTHATLYVKDSVDFNESLASFIGKLGAEQFLAYHFGDTSKQFTDYQNLNNRKEVYKDYMRNRIEWLKGKYESLNNVPSIEEKRTKKEMWIEEIKEGIFSLDYKKDSAELRASLDTLVFNNAYFSGFSTYSGNLPQLKEQLDSEFNGDLKEMITSFKKKYESL